MNNIYKAVFTSFLIVSLLSIVVFASGEASYTFYYEDREITIESSYLSEDEAQMVADYLAYGITPIDDFLPVHSTNTPLLCILFGHSIETSTALETIHNAYETSPKCVRNKYRVEICTRDSCDYIQTTLIDSTRTSICHG